METEVNRIEIVNASTEEERQAIYHFRYQVYVEEMGRNIPGLDHKKEIISDDLDLWSHLVYAKLNGAIVGTFRMSVGNSRKFPSELVEMLLLNRFDEYNPDQKYGLGTKLMVAPLYRNTSLTFKLIVRAYEIVKENKVNFVFTGCNSFLIPMYEQVGYRRYTCGFQDPGYGFVNPLVFITEDIEHLIHVRSPILRIARKFENSKETRKWFMANFPTAKYQANVLISEDERWGYIENFMGDPLSASPLLSNLSRNEAAKLLQVGITLECNKGQQFIRRGDVCNELNILLRGEMSIINKSGQVKRAIPGDILGTVGLLAQTHHEVDAVAASDCEFLAIPRTSFEKLKRRIPNLARKLDFEYYDWEVDYFEKQYRTAIS